MWSPTAPERSPAFPKPGLSVPGTVLRHCPHAVPHLPGASTAGTEHIHGYIAGDTATRGMPLWSLHRDRRRRSPSGEPLVAACSTNPKALAHRPDVVRSAYRIIEGATNYESVWRSSIAAPSQRRAAFDHLPLAGQLARISMCAWPSHDREPVSAKTPPRKLPLTPLREER